MKGDEVNVALRIVSLQILKKNIMKNARVVFTVFGIVLLMFVIAPYVSVQRAWAADSVTVTRLPDTKGPALTVRTPRNGQRITAYSLTVSGTASDASTGGNGIASVTVNGVRASGDTAEGKATARWSIILDSRPNTITVIATDTQGQSTQKTITVNWTHRLSICDADPIILEGPPGAKQSRGCIVNYTQTITDPAYIQQFGTDTVERRYLVYAPKNLPQSPVPVVFMFPGKGTNAETAAYYMTQTRFETLADRDGFVVVYGNGLPFVRDGESRDGWMESGGDFLGCFLEHSGEGIDIQYLREILDQLENELNIDRTRIYATGVSAGGGLCFQLAMEAPDLVAAVAPVVGLPFQPTGAWLFNCNPHPDCGKVPIAMLAATADPAIAYEPGGSAWYPNAQYPGMEQTRDVWLSAMGISGAPTFERLPDKVKSDSYEPQSGVKDSYIELYKYPSGSLGSAFWYYKAVGAGHWWPNPTQMYYELWDTYGKTNQDIDFADQAWAFFQRH
jgi:polyhydroxybutyrate depolymerase